MNHVKLVILFVTAACATNPTADSPGLVLDIEQSDHVAGTFQRDGVTLAFDFARDGRRHTSEYRDAGGDVLVATTLEGRNQKMHILGDRLVIDGLVDAPDPQVAGDLAALAELEARPEAVLLGGLHDALVDADIDVDLYAPAPTSTSNIYDGGDGYFYFGPGESKLWWTAAGLQPTFVSLKNPTGLCATVSLFPGLGIETRVVNARGYDYTGARYWWGALLRIRNEAAWIDWGNQVCGPTTVGVKVSYSWWN